MNHLFSLLTHHSHIDENQTAIGTVTATDVDSDSITSAFQVSEINIDANTGAIDFC